MEPVDRSTIWPYDERGEPRGFYYSRYGHPTGAAAHQQRLRPQHGLPHPHAAVLADRQDRADQVLVHPHAAGDAVHDHADPALAHEPCSARGR